jgi:hypothetical protein
MSHTMTIKTEIRDPTALAAACRRLGLSEPVQGTARLFASQARWPDCKSTRLATSALRHT